MIAHNYDQVRWVHSYAAYIIFKEKYEIAPFFKSLKDHSIKNYSE